MCKIITEDIPVCLQELSSGQAQVCADYLWFDIITLPHLLDAESLNVHLDCSLLVSLL